MANLKNGHVYDDKVRRQAVNILKTGAGHRMLASKLGIPEATARQWARAYAVGGAEAIMNAGRTHRVYPYELKLAAVQDRVDNGLTVREVMVKYGIPSESSIKTWTRQYKKYGPDALVSKPRGARPKNKDVKAVGTAEMPEERAETGSEGLDAFVERSVEQPAALEVQAKPSEDSIEIE